MGKSKLLIYTLTVLLLCIAVFGAVRENTDDRPLYALVTTSGSTEEVSVWYDSYNGIAYFFLPGYAELDQVHLKTSRDGAYQIGAHSVTDGMTCEVFALDETYSVSAPEGFPYGDRKLMFVRSGGVSTLYLDLQSGNMDHVHADKTHSEPGTLRLYGEDGLLLYSGNADSVSGRGQSSWLEEKKSYNVTLHQAANLLDMGAAQKWVLQANAKDPSNLRNKLVFDFAKKVGLASAPDSQWVDLYLNGEYAGLYLLCERIEVHPERVNISGGSSFLVKKDLLSRFRAQGNTYFTTDGNTSLEVVYASGSFDSLTELWQSAENAILAEDGIDPISGIRYQDLIDTNSWARKFLLEETLGNSDAPMLSQYYYLDGSQEHSRIYAGPPWDYDHSFSGSPNQFYVYRDLDYVDSWEHALYQKQEFQDLLEYLYVQEFRPLLLETTEYILDQYVGQVSQASCANAKRWLAPSMDGNVSELKEYLFLRTVFLDSLWLQDEEYVAVKLIGYQGSTRNYWILPGTCMPELDTYPYIEGIFPLGWYYEGTDIPVDPNNPIYEDTTVVFRWEESTGAASDQDSPEPLSKSQILFVLVLLVMMASILFTEHCLNKTRKQKTLR